MNYIEALDYIHSSHRFGMKLGLESTESLMELLGNPQDELNIIHVAGTNGEGFYFFILSQRCLKKVATRLGCLHLHILRYSMETADKWGKYYR